MSNEDNGSSNVLPTDTALSESHYAGATDAGSDTPECETTVERASSADIATAIDDATEDGMYPLIAFGLDKDSRPNQALLVTSSIPDMVRAWEMLDRFLPPEWEFNGYVPWNRLDKFAETHDMIVRKHPIEIPNFVAARDGDFFSNLARDHSASRWHQKAFGLVDICGFSKCTIEQQLAHRTSLALALSQAAARVHKLHQTGFLPGRCAFHSTSTGDGFYFWHRWAGSANDVAVFMLLVYVMVQTEAMRSTRRSTMRLRGAFGIGEAYTFPFRDLSNPWTKGPLPQDAIGPVVNSLNRLLKDADPGQFLIGDFERPGPSDREPTLTPANLIEQAERQLLPSELIPKDSVKPQHISLSFDPKERLRVSDKHEDIHYCYNLVGKVPNRFKDVRIFQVGIVPEKAMDMACVNFCRPTVIAQ